MFCANIPEQQSSCRIYLENRLFGQKLSLKSQTCLVPPAPQKKHSAEHYFEKRLWRRKEEEKLSTIVLPVNRLERRPLVPIRIYPLAYIFTFNTIMSLTAHHTLRKCCVWKLCLKMLLYEFLWVVFRPSRAPLFHYKPSSLFQMVGKRLQGSF